MIGWVYVQATVLGLKAIIRVAFQALARHPVTGSDGDRARGGRRRRGRAGPGTGIGQVSGNKLGHAQNGDGHVFGS